MPKKHGAIAPSYLSPQEAAARIGVSVDTIRRRIADGSLPATRVGRLIRIHVDDLDNLLRPIPHARVGGAA